VYSYLLASSTVIHSKNSVYFAYCSTVATTNQCWPLLIMCIAFSLRKQGHAHQPRHQEKIVEIWSKSTNILPSMRPNLTRNETGPRGHETCEHAV